MLCQQELPSIGFGVACIDPLLCRVDLRRRTRFACRASVRVDGTGLGNYPSRVMRSPFDLGKIVVHYLRVRIGTMRYFAASRSGPGERKLCVGDAGSADAVA